MGGSGPLLPLQGPERWPRSGLALELGDRLWVCPWGAPLSPSSQPSGPAVKEEGGPGKDRPQEEIAKGKASPASFSPWFPILSAGGFHGWDLCSVGGACVSMGGACVSVGGACVSVGGACVSVGGVCVSLGAPLTVTRTPGLRPCVPGLTLEGRRPVCQHRWKRLIEVGPTGERWVTECSRGDALIRGRTCGLRLAREHAAQTPPGVRPWT